MDRTHHFRPIHCALRGPSSTPPRAAHFSPRRARAGALGTLSIARYQPLAIRCAAHTPPSPSVVWDRLVRNIPQLRSVAQPPPGSTELPSAAPPCSDSTSSRARSERVEEIAPRLEPSGRTHHPPTDAANLPSRAQGRTDRDTDELAGHRWEAQPAGINPIPRCLPLVHLSYHNRIAWVCTAQESNTEGKD
jgi:hypothetical protein